VIYWWHYCIAVGASIIAILMLSACSHVASDLELRQNAVQECVLQGGRPELGPGGTIICR
jgi:hypothetical protein